MDEAEKKVRKHTTSAAVRDRYNAKVYDVISVRIPKELAAQFKEKCQLTGDSQAGIIKRAIEAYLE